MCADTAKDYTYGYGRVIKMKDMEMRSIRERENCISAFTENMLAVQKERNEIETFLTLCKTGDREHTTQASVCGTG